MHQRSLGVALRDPNVHVSLQGHSAIYYVEPADSASRTAQRACANGVRQKLASILCVQASGVNALRKGLHALYLHTLHAPSNYCPCPHQAESPAAGAVRYGDGARRGNSSCVPQP